MITSCRVTVNTSSFCVSCCTIVTWLKTLPVTVTPILFGASVTGKVFKQVPIGHQDTQKDDVFQRTLQGGIISSYQLGGDQSSEVPAEQLGFSYRKICVADSVTGSKGCWDLQLGRTF